MSGATIEHNAWSDARFEHLAQLCGYANRFEAIGRMAYLWDWCIEQCSYVASRTVICRHLGPGGDTHLLEADLGDLQDDGLIRVRGTVGRIEWKEKLRAASRAGGEANRKRLEAKRLAVAEPSGFAGRSDGAIGEPDGSPMASQSRARAEPELSPSSSSSSQISLSQAAPACDPPAPAQAPVAKGSGIHGTPGKIAQLVQHAIDRIDAARRQLDPGAQLLVSAIRVGQPARDLMDRLMPIDERERQKVLDHVLDVVIAEAKADGAVDKLSLGFVAGERAWPMHVAATVGGSIRRPRSPPPVPPRRDPARGSVPARADSHTDGTGVVRIEKEF